MWSRIWIEGGPAGPGRLWSSPGEIFLPWAVGTKLRSVKSCNSPEDCFFVPTAEGRRPGAGEAKRCVSAATEACRRWDPAPGREEAMMVGWDHGFPLPTDPGPIHRRVLRVWYWIEDRWRSVSDEDKILIAFIGLLAAFWYRKLR